jgi:hypothetical protein
MNSPSFMKISLQTHSSCLLAILVIKVLQSAVSHNLTSRSESLVFLLALRRNQNTWMF